MRKIFLAAINAGIRPAQDIDELKKIRGLNMGCLLGMAVAFLLAILNAVTGFYPLAVLHFSVILVSCCIILLQGRGLYRVAHYVGVLEIMIISCFAAIAYHNSMEILLLLNILAVVLLFEMRREQWVLSLMNVALFTWIRYYNDHYPPLIAQAPFSRHILSYVNGSLILGILIGYYKREQQRNRRQLEAMNLELKEKAATLENLNRVKEKILSILSHDLRQPLASMKTLLSMADDVGPEYFSTFTKRVETHVDNVMLTLENTLRWSYSQMKGITLLPQDVSMEEALLPLPQQFAEQLRNKQITLSLSVSPEYKAYVDPEHLTIVMRNLLSNAIKFTREGGEIRITVALEAEHLVVTVADTGIGMDQEMLEKLFDLEQHFTRYGTGNERGVGLGLMVVKELVTLNEGKIRLQSEVGKGTTVVLELSLP